MVVDAGIRKRDAACLLPRDDLGVHRARHERGAAPPHADAAYISARLFCDGPSPCSAARRYHAAARASSSATPLPWS